MVNNGRLHLVSFVQYLVPALFLLLLSLQALDLHSTLSASAVHHESNKAINWLADRIGFTAAVTAFKAIAVMCLLLLYQVWHLSKHTHDREFALCLTLINTVYLVVVSNNYLS